MQKQINTTQEQKLKLLAKINQLNQNSIHRIYTYVSKADHKVKKINIHQQTSKNNQEVDNNTNINKIKCYKKRQNQYFNTKKTLHSYFTQKTIPIQQQNTTVESIHQNSFNIEMILNKTNQYYSKSNEIISQFITKKQQKKNKKNIKLIHIEQNYYGLDIKCLKSCKLFQNQYYLQNPFERNQEIQYQLNSEEEFQEIKFKLRNSQESSQNEQEDKSEQESQQNSFIENKQASQQYSQFNIQGQYVLKWNKWLYNHHFPNKEIQNRYKIISNINQSYLIKQEKACQTNEIIKKKKYKNKPYNLIQKFPMQTQIILKVLKQTKTKKQIVSILSPKFMVAPWNILVFVNDFCVKNKNRDGFIYCEQQINNNNIHQCKLQQYKNMSNLEIYQQQSTCNSNLNNSKYFKRKLTQQSQKMCESLNSTVINKKPQGKKMQKKTKVFNKKYII